MTASVNKVIPITDQLKMINILSALILHLLLKSFHSNVPFEMAIASSVNIKLLCGRNDFEGCHFCEGAKVSKFV